MSLVGCAAPPFSISVTQGVRYYRMTGGSFLVGAKNFKDSGETFSRKVPARGKGGTGVRAVGRAGVACLS